MKKLTQETAWQSRRVTQETWCCSFGSPCCWCSRDKVLKMSYRQVWLDQRYQIFEQLASKSSRTCQEQKPWLQSYLWIMTLQSMSCVLLLQETFVINAALFLRGCRDVYVVLERSWLQNFYYWVPQIFMWFLLRANCVLIMSSRVTLMMWGTHLHQLNLISKCIFLSVYVKRSQQN